MFPVGQPEIAVMAAFPAVIVVLAWVLLVIMSPITATWLVEVLVSQKSIPPQPPTPVGETGQGLIQRTRLLLQPDNTELPRLTVRGRRTISLANIPQLRHQQRLVPRSLCSLSQEKGWHRVGDTYQGEFQANGRSWRGEIRCPYPGGYEVYIYDLPIQQLKRHPHWPCFRRKGRNGRFKVHFAKTPQNVDHVISNVETILAEALALR